MGDDSRRREWWHDEPGTHWARERSYSSSREYGDGRYGWPQVPHEWRSSSRPQDYPDFWYARQGYGGPYHPDRTQRREWSSSEGWVAPGPYEGRGPRGYRRPDDRIREEINERLTRHGLIDATDIECEVTSGDVTLTGWVDSRAAKRAAEDLAESVYGVRDVHNQLRIRERTQEKDGVGRTAVLGLTAPAAGARSEVEPSESTAPPAANQVRQRTRA